MIPDRVRQASQRALSFAAPLSVRPAVGQAGELSLAYASAGGGKTTACARIVAVLEADPGTKTVTVQLATNEVEQATDLDLVVPAHQAGAPFALAVQAELYGPLFAEQLGALIGDLDEGQVHALSSALLSDGESLAGYPTGLPLAGLDDPRRRFKAEELADLSTLVAECRRWLAGASAPSQTLDPELLLPPPAGTPADVAADQFIELLDVLDDMERSAVPLPSEIVTLLLESDLLDEIARWRTEFGLDAARVLSCFTIVDSVTTGPAPIPAPAAEGPYGGRRSDGVLNPFLESQADSGNVVVDIRTSHRCWRHDAELRIVTTAAGRSCRARARLAKVA